MHTRFLLGFAFAAAAVAACSSVVEVDQGKENAGGAGSTVASSTTFGDQAVTSVSSVTTTTVTDAASSTSTGFGGFGGFGTGGAGGFGASMPFMTADHPPPPQLVSQGGQVLSMPKVQPIVYAQDPFAKDYETFVSQLASSTAWDALASQYGVGALTALPPIEIQDPIPAMATEDTYLVPLDANTHGASPAWGQADPNTIYAFLIPESQDFESDGSSCCTGYGGYHYEVVLSGGVHVTYAMICQCDFMTGGGVEDGTTLAASHEILEASTDPFILETPAYSHEDAQHGAFTDGTLGEIGDMCILTSPLTVDPPDMTYAIQRMWSNQAATEGLDPCQPADPSVPYYNAVPVLSDEVPLMLVDGSMSTTDGVSIPVGASKTIPVDLFSTAPTSGWTVEAYDVEQIIYGSAPTLDFSWDTQFGANGDVLNLTIHSLAQDPNFGSSVFLILSSDGQTRHFWFGAVGH